MQAELSLQDAIRAEFNGRNHAHVMAKFTISRSRLYEIINAKA